MGVMKAYHSDELLKANILAALAAHRESDEIVKGHYWENGKGCAVGCTIKSGDHMAYEPLFGIPVALAYLEDRIFEGLPNELAEQWPERFMSAIRVGSDLSLVQWKFLHWLLTDLGVNPGINDSMVAESVSRCAEVLEVLADGGEVGLDAAESAAQSAESAAGSAAWSAESAYGWSLMADKLIDLIKSCQ
jgi:hypothetical protein